MTGIPSEEIMHKATALIYERNTWLLERYGPKGKDRTNEDNLHHLNHLATARELRNSDVFKDYAVWLAGLLQSHGMKAALVIENFEILKNILSQEYSGYQESADYCRMLEEGIAVLQEKMIEKEPVYDKKQNT